jgi:hypothetical protein
LRRAGGDAEAGDGDSATAAEDDDAACADREGTRREGGGGRRGVSDVDLGTNPARRASALAIRLG